MDRIRLYLNENLDGVLQKIEIARESEEFLKTINNLNLLFFQGKNNKEAKELANYIVVVDEFDKYTNENKLDYETMKQYKAFKKILSGQGLTYLFEDYRRNSMINSMIKEGK